MVFHSAAERPSDAPFVEMVWQTQSDNAGSFIAQAVSRWDIVLMQYQGKTTLTVRGPDTKATPVLIPADAEWMGITFKLGTFMPLLPPGKLRDGCSVDLPNTSKKSFWLHGSSWEFPTYENADTFVTRLKRAGLLEYDPIVDAVLQGHPPAFSPRTLQYRFLRATGLTQNKVIQIERARRAAELLVSGRSLFDTAYEVGYFDQSHMTNALKRFLGQTPKQIAAVILPE